MGKTSRRRDIGGTAPLQELLEGALAGLDMGVQLRQQAALRAWERVVGKAIGTRARAEAVRDGVLIVAADSPAWAQELRMRQAELLARLRGFLGEDAIRDIHFRSRSRPPGGRPAERGERPADEALSSRQVQEVQRAAASIGDRELRESAERALASLIRIGIWRRRTGWRQCPRCGQWQHTGKRWCSSCAHRRGKGP